MFDNFQFEETSFAEAKKNIRGQATKLVHDIAQAYERGHLEDPNASVMFCSLLALICEGKIKGIFNEEFDRVDWTLTPEYEAELEMIQEAALATALQTKNVIKGPWV